MPSSVIKESRNLYKLRALSLRALRDRLKGLPSYKDKVDYLLSRKEVKFFLETRGQSVLQDYSIEEKYYILCLITIDQSHVLKVCSTKEASDNLFKCLRNLEAFFSEIGGIIGYQILALDLLEHRNFDSSRDVQQTFYPPQGFDVTKPSKELDDVIALGICSQDKLAEIYPVGGAADRLNLHDEQTHMDLPAAKLEFLGKTLLEGIIRDLQAREYLFYKVTRRQVQTPIALMTSEEKSNDRYIREIFKQQRYFYRNRKNFKFFVQPLVPTFTDDGLWCLKDDHNLLTKPGGHGVIWKLAKEQGVLDWLKAQNKQKVLLRQINNPIAGVDLGLLALVGLGFKSKKCFGFASCLRRVQTSEGINILKERQTEKGYNIVLSNIEYCDFKKFNILDEPKEESDKYSVFPSNTNILFADIHSTEEAVKRCPFPGSLVNFKEMEHFKDSIHVKGNVARVELLMQNIADGFEKCFEKSAKENPNPDVRAFMTFNKRHKTISPTKKQFVPGAGLVETAMGCFYDYLVNIYDLFVNYCEFDMPDLSGEEDFLKDGLDFLVVYHPGLGPLYSIISQKIRKGCLLRGSELQLEIAELDIENLHLDGSLCIKADQILGHIENDELVYSERVGCCILKNVTVKNLGLDHYKDNVFWKNKIYRSESLSIHLEGSSMFIAEDVNFVGQYDIRVKHGTCLIAKMIDNQVEFEEKTLEEGCAWNYEKGLESKILLSK